MFLFIIPQMPFSLHLLFLLLSPLLFPLILHLPHFRCCIIDLSGVVGDIGPIEPPSAESVNAIASPSDVSESSINWSAMNSEQEHRTTGSVDNTALV